MSERMRTARRRDPRTADIARHARTNRRQPLRTFLKVLAAVLTVGLVSTAAVAALAIFNVASSVKPGVQLGGTIPVAEMPSIGAYPGGANIVLVGSDSRVGQGDGFGDPTEETAVLNDVTMLIHIAEDHQSATAISFPRDTFVDIPECTGADGNIQYETTNKINSTYSLGLKCTVDTVAQLTGLQIPFAMSMQFDGAAALADAVGGVTVCIAEPIQDARTDLDLPAGEVKLSGIQALQFMRTRHGVGDGSDLGRISNQQVFLSALVRELKSSNTLSNPIKLYSIAQVAAAKMEFSASLSSIDTLVALGLSLKDIPLDQVTFVQWPTGLVDGGLSTDWNSANWLLGKIKADVPPVLSPDRAGFESVPDPNAPATPTPDPTNPTSPADASPVTPDSDPPPANLYGQTAGDHTCSSGRPVENQ